MVCDASRVQLRNLATVEPDLCLSSHGHINIMTLATLGCSINLWWRSIFSGKWPHLTIAWNWACFLKRCYAGTTNTSECASLPNHFHGQHTLAGAEVYIACCGLHDPFDEVKSNFSKPFAPSYAQSPLQWPWQWQRDYISDKCCDEQTAKTRFWTS